MRQKLELERLIRFFPLYLQAHLLGLHRSCEDWDIPRNEKETRKRVWWALYITDRFQTAILGRPINLRDEVWFVIYSRKSCR
jgi:hypothetical protein